MKTQAQENHLNSYLTLAVESSPLLKAKFDKYLAALEKLPQAKALPDPTVMFNLFASPVETRVGAQRAGLSINQAFPWFGQLKAQEESAGLEAKAVYEVFINEKNKLQYQLRALYYDLYMVEAAILTSKRNVELLNSFKELSRVKLESGKGSAVDLLRAEMQATERLSQLDYLIDSQTLLRAEFRAMLNVDADFPIIVPGVLEPEGVLRSKEDLIESMLIDNPRLKEMDFEVLRMDSEIGIAKKLGKPSFNVGASYINVAKRDGMTIPNNGKDALIFPQLGLRIPFNRKKYDALIKEKSYLKSANTHLKEDRGNVLTVALEEAWRNHKDAIRRVELNTKLTGLANQSLEVLVTEYTSAGRDLEEILRMEEKLLEYELELEKAKADQSTSAALIKYLIGN